MIDVCVIATLRPKILNKTMESFKKHIKYSGKFRGVINLDMVPESNCAKCDIGYIIKIVEKYFHDHILRISYKPSFAKAVKWCWSKTISDYVFHLEDDWEFIREIDLDSVMSEMEDYVRFPKERAPILDRLALQPSLWKGDLVRNLSKHMVTDKDPEKQLRIGSVSEDIDKIIETVKRLDYQPACCKDIGREWRDERGLQKWNKNIPGEITWTIK